MSTIRGLPPPEPRPSPPLPLPLPPLLPALNAEAPIPAPAQTPAQVANHHALVEANEMLKANDYDGALAKVNQVIQSDPRNINAFLIRGQIYSHMKQPDKEANDFQSAHLIDPTNPVANFDVAESKFGQKQYDAARAEFLDLAKDPTTFIGDLAAFKVFLCDMMAGHTDQAQQEFDAFNKIGRRASYYYANATWDIAHKNYDDARSWLGSANGIYAPQKRTLYLRSMHDTGFLPLPPAAGRAVTSDQASASACTGWEFSSAGIVGAVSAATGALAWSARASNPATSSCTVFSSPSFKPGSSISHTSPVGMCS